MTLECRYHSNSGGCLKSLNTVSPRWWPFKGDIKVIAYGVRNFRTLKNKYNCMLCQSRLHTASAISICHKKLWIGFNDFRIRSKHFQAFWEFRATVQANVKIQNGDCQVHPLPKALYTIPCTRSSQKLVVFFLICGSSIASKASHWSTDIPK